MTEKQDTATMLARVSELKLDKIVSHAAEKNHCTVQEIFSDLRSPRVQNGRVEVYTTLRKMGWSYSDIGSLFGRRHTTVMIAVNGRERKSKKDVARTDAD